MADHPSISVLLPVFNGELYLREALGSVVPQLAGRDELIVQDGGSTDRTLEFLAEYSHLSNVRVESALDEGQTDALMRALARATGDYIGWLNADDLMAPSALDAVRRGIAATPDVTMLYGNFQIVVGANEIARTLRPAEVSTERLIAKGCFIFSGATYLCRLAVAELGFNRELHYSMDYDLFVRLSETPGFSSAYVDSTLGAFRYHRESKSGTTYVGFIRDSYHVRRAARMRNGTSFPIVVPTILHSLAVLSRRLRYTRMYAHVRGRTHATGGRGARPSIR